MKINFLKQVLQYAIILSFYTSATWAGGEAHGGNHVKDFILWSQRISLKLLKSPICAEILNNSDCDKLTQKLSNKIIWYDSMATGDLVPMTAKLNGQTIVVTFRTTEDLDSPIEVDVNRAATLTITDDILMLLHEVGHVLGISDDLTMDKMVIKQIDENISLRTTLVLAQSVPIPKFDDTKVDAGPTLESVSQILTRALNIGEKSPGYAVEKAVLVGAIQRVMASQSSQGQEYLKSTLEAALDDMGIYEKDSDEVLLVRRSICSAIEDYNFISSSGAQGAASLRNYGKGILAQGLSSGFRSSLPAQEVLVEVRALQRTLLLLETLPTQNQDLLAKVKGILANDEKLFSSDETVRLEFLRSSIRWLIE